MSAWVPNTSWCTTATNINWKGDFTTDWHGVAGIKKSSNAKLDVIRIMTGMLLIVGSTFTIIRIMSRLTCTK
ncbi:unnamed protein product [Acanthoscelides obtectus]|uniref:Uncharacterized protein n=1 Tax=Acanthoscelides obtectus TaxID=200917 RepID=A0A9P0M7E6_ACAOB|nr:unnamed protein product [Acanthoscelides obtectus]CAK1676574.1 hypothetical protein AOBTE_LOCUS30829 [Acanthoscelides obtectus]